MAKSTRSGEPVFTTRKVSKLGAVLGTAALTLSGLVAVSAPAQAALAGVGPTDPSTGFPSFYTDEGGMSLQLCIDSITLCIADATGPISAPDGEAFYWAADASAGGIDGHWALEAAFGEAGEPEVFQRTQFAAEDGALVPGATYTITDPFGSLTCTADGSGGIVNNGCRTESDPAEGFGGALNGRLGPFLTATSGAPAGYIGGGPDSSSTVTGSPTGFNMFRVQGPGITGTCTGGIPNCSETSLFAISGKLAPGAAAQVDVSPLDFGNAATAVTKNISYSSVGTLPAEVASVTSNNSAFAVTHNCASVASGSSCSISVTYNPTAGASAAGVLTITDNTGPEGAANVRTVDVSGRSLPVASVPTGASLDFGSQKLADGATPAKTVRVTNTGAAPLTVSSLNTGSGDFTASGCATAVPAGGSCDVSVTFNPSTTGAKAETLTINTDGGNKAVALKGTGTTASIAAVASYTYADTAVGTSRTGAVTVTNSGDAAMVLGARTLGGANPSDFRLGSTTAGECVPGGTLAANSSCRVTVAFAPRALGARSATLTVTGDGAVKNIALSGRGVDRTLPTVVSRGPAANATAVARGANVSVGFSEAVRGVSRATFRLTNQSTGRTMAATVTRVGTTNRWVLNPTALMSARTRYTARLVGGSTAIRDLSNNALRSTSWSFRTR